MKLTCPKCSNPIGSADANLSEGVCVCPHCQEFFKISGLLTEDIEVTRVAKPLHTQVEFVADRETLGFIVPSGRSRGAGFFLLFFALFWNSITWLGFAGAIAKFEIIPILFLIPFILIGLLVALACVYVFFGEFTFSIDRRECRAIWSVFKWNFTRKATTAQINGVVEDVVYRKNYQPVYGIAIKHGNSTLKFGSDLNDEERKWLIGEIRHFLKV